MSIWKTTLALGASLALAGNVMAQCPAGDDAFEQNDDCATAVVLPTGLHSGLIVHGSGSLGLDEDYFSITLLNGEQLDVTLYDSTPLGDVDIYLYDVAGGFCHDEANFLAAPYAVTPTENILWSNFTGSTQTYILVVDLYDMTLGCTTYDLDLTVGVAPPSPCTLPDDGFEDNDDCFSAVPIADGSHTGLWLSSTDEDWYTTTLADGGTLTVDIFFTNAIADVDLELLDITGACPGVYLAGGYSVDDNESATFTNVSGADIDIAINVYMFAPGSDPCIIYDMDVSGGTPGVLGVPFCFGDGSDGGACPCGNIPAVGSEQGCVNVSGVGAKISASGVPSVAADTLVLMVEGAAPSDFGIFVQNISTQAPAPFYNGLFCLAADSHLVRHYGPPAIQPTITDANGMGINAQPMTVGDFVGDIIAGVTVYFQFWGRDNGGACGSGANFSSGRSIVYLP